MNNWYFLVAAGAALFAAVQSEAKETRFGTNVKTEVLKPVDYFQCSKPDGNYEHDDKCSPVYITCKSGKAFEKKCPICDPDPILCPFGHLYYNAVQDTCVVFPNAGCGPPPTACPRNCSQIGDCFQFSRCEEPFQFDDNTMIEWGVWREYNCPKDLFWNPTPGVTPGGHCDFFYNLPLEVQTRYRRDPKCFPSCRWEEHESKEGRCTGLYYYWNRVDPNQHDVTRQTLSCPSPLVFNPALETCDHCENVREGECCHPK